MGKTRPPALPGPSHGADTCLNIQNKIIIFLFSLPPRLLIGEITLFHFFKKLLFHKIKIDLDLGYSLCLEVTYQKHQWLVLFKVVLITKTSYGTLLYKYFLYTEMERCICDSSQVEALEVKTRVESNFKI